MKLVWFPAWVCQNYTFGRSFGSKCPYCPYSLNRETNRLIYNNVEAGSDDRADADVLVGFFNENFSVMGGHLEISGGEALMRRDIHDILSRINHRWAMTSNTLAESVIDAIIEAGALKRCVSWSASWHPHSGAEKRYARNIEALAGNGLLPRATVVIAGSTVGSIRETKRFLDALPIAGINWHLDTHGDMNETEFLKGAAESALGSGVVLLAGPPKRGIMCDRHDKLMALGPGGTLYQCVTFAYQNKFPVCKVARDTRLDSLPRRLEWCDDECFACCDWIKHS